MKRWPDFALELLCLNTDWLWETNERGELASWRGSQRITELEPELPAGAFLHWRNYLRHDYSLRDNQAKLLRALRAGEPFRCLKVACWLPHLPSMRGWLRMTGVPVHNAEGRIIGYRGVAQNVTGAMMAEHKLQRLDDNNKNLRMAIEHSSTPVFIARQDLPGCPIIYVNPAMHKTTGYSEAEMMGRNPLFMGNKDPDDKALSHLQQSLMLKAQDKQQIQLNHKDGGKFWAEVTLLPGWHEEGKAILIGFVRDVSIEVAQKLADEQRSRLEALGRLAGGMAHEINNLLQPAALNVEILGDGNNDKRAMTELLRDIQESLEQISYIVRNTLQFARVSSDSKHVETAEFLPMVCERIAYLKALLPATVQLDMSGVEGVNGLAAVNPTELTQVLTNLCTNAAHAMSGKGTIHISLASRELDGVRASRNHLPQGRYYALTVRDNGIGMNEKTLKHLFEPFFTTKKVGEGTGLGLSVVYGLVTGWGGAITVKSKVGKGTEFTVFVPEALPGVAGAICLTGEKNGKRKTRTLS